MTKLIFFFLVFLSACCQVFGQSDSNSVSKDTTIVRPKTEQRIKSDSGDRAPDTASMKPRAVVKKAVVASPMAASPVAAGVQARMHDSGSVRKDTVRRAGLKKDSLVSAGIPIGDPSQGSPVAGSSQGPPARQSGPDEVTLWRAALAVSPYFHFLGRPVLQKEAIHRPNSKDSLFYLLLGILFYFALFRIFFEKYFSNLLTLFFRVSLRQQQIREQVLQTPLPSLLLNLLFVATSGLFAAFLLHFSRSGASINFWILYLDCIMGLGLIYLVKFVVLKFCGWVFNISRATDIYIFITFLVNKMVGIFLLPLLILITFSEQQTRDIFITISLTMIFVLLGYRVFASYRPVRNEIKLTPFHYFLYLCAFEIAPLLLIYKVLLQYLEKGY
jgi:Domain of unknown function (DUF4271)